MPETDASLQLSAPGAAGAEVTLDAARMPLDKSGLKDFVWPLSRAEVEAMRDACLAPLCAAARGDGEDDAGAELLRIVIGPLINEAMSVYQAIALARRFGELGRRLETVEDGRMLGPVARRETPRPSGLFGDLVRGVPRAVGRGRPSLHRTLTHLRWNGVSPRMFRGLDVRSEVVAIQNLPVVDIRARMEPAFVRFMNPAQWFPPLTSGNSNVVAEADTRRAIDGAVEAFRVGFGAGNEDLPGHLATYLRDWMAEAMRLSDRRLATIVEDSRKVPRRLWTGSGAGIWSRVLRHATRRLGGTVTGHDHGNGTGHLVSSTATIAEFEACDTFVTYTQAQADGLRKSAVQGPQLSDSIPEIVAVQDSSAGPVGGRNGSAGRSRTSIRKMMFASICYPGEMLHYFPLLPTPVAADWHARLISNVRGWGYEMLLKPHPSSSCAVPQTFTEELGATLLTGRFENVLAAADAVMFDSPMSTTFGVALASDKPVVLIDLGRAVFRPEALALLERRCRVVKGWFDEENRVQTDWDELHRAIEESRDLNDPAYVRSYRLT